MATKKIDIRIIKLSKWQIPKSEDIFSYHGQEKNAFLSIGYFDMIEVQEVTGSELDHPLLRAFYSSHRHQNEKDDESSQYEHLMKNYTTQELILFTNIGEEGFSKRKIESFWKTDSLLTFVSLIHVDNDTTNGSSPEVNDLIDRINRIFNRKNYLYYFSFDYSGIVILAKNMSIQQYLKVLFQLNFENEDNNRKWIRDSFSLYGLDKRILRECFSLLKEKKSIKELIPELYRNDQFSAAVNIGVQNYAHYRDFYDELKNDSFYTKGVVDEYGLLGRHDISIVNNSADLEWLIWIQYLLNKYTIKSEQNLEDSLFSTYETFVKLKEPPVYGDMIIGVKNEAYQCAANHLDKLCNRLEKNLLNNRERYCGEYISPIRAVKYSILSILKNRFAEDFVLCMYQSFVEFLSYLIEKTELEVDDVSAFDKTFNEYFRGLNSLVNSAMHSERQFVQATAFNAIIYDVPSKIMAFYVATIQELQNLVRSEKDKRYTFLLTPSFREQIFVRVISYKKEKPPHDRILMVSISERSLYNPSQVIHCMAHEVAHFVGDELRNRNMRKQCLISSLVHLILCDLFPRFFYFSEKFDSLKKDIIKEFTSWDFYLEQGNYSDDLDNLASIIPAEFHKNANIKELIKKFIANEIEGCSNQEQKKNIEEFVSYISKQETGMDSNMFKSIIVKETEYTCDEICVLTNLIWEDMYRRISEIYSDVSVDIFMGELLPSSVPQLGSGILKKVPISEYLVALKSAYSESFADIQMILLLGITYEKYLISFVSEEQLDISIFETSTEDVLRVVAVVMIMKYVKFWEIPRKADLFKDFHDTEQNSKNEKELKRRMYKELIDFHTIIQKKIEIIENTIDFDNAEVLDELCKKVQKYKKVICAGEKMDENCHRDSDEYIQLDDPLGDDLLTPLVVELLKYLKKCVDQSVEHYAQKTDDIIMLKKTIDPVIACDNIKQVFFKVCQEIDKYKSSLFNPTQ